MSHLSEHNLSPEHLSELLPQYDAEHFIAQGGMGAVYKGRQISLDRDVAIKILLREVSESEEFQESFISEAKLMAKLNHINLLGVYDFGTIDDMSYIVMEYVEGGSLHEACWNQKIDAVQAITIIKGICDGLSHAHNSGIVHRDIKPANILLTQDAVPKVADFGLAQRSDADKPGLMMGTPGYTAPEVFDDPDQAGQLADIYSVGVILHQLLTGLDPSGSMVPPAQATNNIRLDAIWRKATNIQPAQRYTSIDAMSQELDKWLDAKKNLLQAGAPAAFNVTQQKFVVSKNSGVGTFVKVALICAVAAIGFFLYKNSQTPNEDLSNDTNHADQYLNSFTEEPAPEPDVKASPPKHEIEPLPNPEPSHSEPIKEPKTTLKLEPMDEPEPTEKPKVTKKLPLGDADLHDKAISLIDAAREDRDKERAQNSKLFQSQISSLSRNEKEDVETFVKDLKKHIVNNRIPKTNNLEGISPKLVDAIKEAQTKDKAIDTNHQTNLTRIRDAYVTRLLDAANKEAEQQMKYRLSAQAENATELDAWVKLLSPLPEEEPMELVRWNSNSFVGKWEMVNHTGIELWVAHPGGRLTVVDRKWEAEWIILEDGTLELKWGGKKNPYVLQRDGSGWVGKTSYNQDIKLTPGDW